MMSYTQPNFDQLYIKVRYLNQFVSEMIDYWHQDSTRCALQYEVIKYVTMATYLVPDLPDVGVPFWYFSVMPYFPDLASI